MKNFIDQKLIEFNKILARPLYLVGGFVRNFLIDKSTSTDLDVCGAIPVEELKGALENFGEKVLAVYKRTGTLVFKINGKKYEYTRFRKDGYSAGGNHQPDTVVFTDDITEDALRRDFKCNAIYYDVLGDKFIDPLGGIEDVKNKILDTVKDPKEVFSHDGLRLMRLARFCGELGFTPTKKVLKGARENASNILDISVERIYEELSRICLADPKYSFSPLDGHYRALKVLDQTATLDKIIPELTLGRGMEQRKDYHKYDVLEHTLKTVLYSQKSVRLYALLHDVGKPFCMQKDGKYHFHDIEGARLAKSVLLRLKAPKQTIETCVFLTRYHMLDMKKDMKKAKLRRFIVKNLDKIDLLLDLKQADFSACKDNLEVCPTVQKWREIMLEMKTDGTPINLKQLKITASELIEIGYLGKEIGKELNKLWDLCINSPQKNDRDYLIKKAIKDLK